MARSAVKDELKRCKTPSNGKNGVISNLQLGSEGVTLSHSSSRKGSREKGLEMHLEGWGWEAVVSDDGI